MMRSVFLTPFCKVSAADFFVDKRVTNTYSMIRYTWNRISVFHPKRKRSCFSWAILIAMVIICSKAKICGFSYMILLLCPFRRIYDIRVYIIRNEQVNMYSWIISFIYTRQYFTNASVCTQICDARLSLCYWCFSIFLINLAASKYGYRVTFETDCNTMILHIQASPRCCKYCFYNWSWDHFIKMAKQTLETRVGHYANCFMIYNFSSIP